jgi:hypothetical protein
MKFLNKWDKANPDVLSSARTNVWNELYISSRQQPGFEIWFSVIPIVSYRIREVMQLVLPHEV